MLWSITHFSRCKIHFRMVFVSPKMLTLQSIMLLNLPEQTNNNNDCQTIRAELCSRWEQPVNAFISPSSCVLRSKTDCTVHTLALLWFEWHKLLGNFGVEVSEEFFIRITQCCWDYCIDGLTINSFVFDFNSYSVFTERTWTNRVINRYSI